MLRRICRCLTGAGRGLVGAALVVAAVTLAVVAAPSRVQAQPRRFAEEPTEGLSLPAGALAGDHDATAVDLNPAGLTFLGGSHVELAFTTPADGDAISAAGSGLGFYAATPVDIPFLPRLGFGVAIERLTPPRIALAPDPGVPVRLSFATAWDMGWLSAGVTWHHFIDDESGQLDGLDTFDAGLAMRAGSHLA